LAVQHGDESRGHRKDAIDFICTIPPPLYILGKDASKSIVRKDEFTEKIPSYFSMRGWQSPGNLTVGFAGKDELQYL